MWTRALDSRLTSAELCVLDSGGVPSALMMVSSLLHALGDHILDFMPLCAQHDEPPGITKAFLAAVLACIDSCSN